MTKSRKAKPKVCVPPDVQTFLDRLGEAHDRHAGVRNSFMNRASDEYGFGTACAWLLDSALVSDCVCQELEYTMGEVAACADGAKAEAWLGRYVGILTDRIYRRLTRRHTLEDGKADNRRCYESEIDHAQVAALAHTGRILARVMGVAVPGDTFLNDEETDDDPT